MAAYRPDQLRPHQGRTRLGQVDTRSHVAAQPADDRTGGEHKWRLIAGLLFRDGCFSAAVSVLAHLAEGGDGIASQLLAGVLAQTDRVPALRQRAAAGDVAAVRQLAAIAAEHGWDEELLRLSEIDVYAACALAGRLVATGRIDAALAILRARADLGEQVARVRLAALLSQHRRIDELRARADAGDWDCALRLIEILCAAGPAPEALGLLGRAANDGSTAAAGT